MAYDFPASPTQGQQFTPVAGGPTYAWNGYAWDVSSPAVVPGTLVELARQVVTSSVAQVDFIGKLDATYDEYEVHFFDVVPSVASTHLSLQIGQSGTIQSAASYRFGFNSVGESGTNNPVGSAAAAAILITHTSNLDNVASNPVSGRVCISRPATSGTTKPISFVTTYLNVSGNLLTTVGGGVWAANANPINSLRFLMFASGNIASGTFVLYGISKTPLLNMTPLLPVGSKILIQTQTVSAAVAQVDFISKLDTTYDEYELRFFGVLAGGNDLQLRLGQNGTFLTANYSYSNYDIGNTGGAAPATQGSMLLHMAGRASSNVNYPLSGVISIAAPSVTGIVKNMLWNTCGWDSTAGTVMATTGGGLFTGNFNPITDLRMLVTAGNIAQGTFNLYGIKK